MFQKILFKILNLLGKLYGRFNVAYNEVYSDKNTGIIANTEIEKRKIENKEKFIYALAGMAIIRAFKQDGVILNPKKAREYAEFVFNREKEKGNIDELNNVKEDFDE